MVVSGGSGVLSLDSRFERGFELFEGIGQIKKLSERNLYALGNFCFVDYNTQCKITDLSENQLAELLYLGHMFKPLVSPFFEQLQNRFVYLAHDDGYYCKLYCRELNDFIPVLVRKIADFRKPPLPEVESSLGFQLLKQAANGVLIDLDESFRTETYTDVKLYSIGDYSDTGFDYIFNDLHSVKNNAKQINTIRIPNR